MKMNTFQLNEQNFPLGIAPDPEIADLWQWAAQQKSAIRSALNQHGAVLLRGFSIADTETFEAFVAAITDDEWVDYREAATPRSHVRGHVFTSTEYPATERIFFHNENSHTTSWPLYLAFYCQTPALVGGATPITDCRKIYQDIPQVIRQQFESRKILYCRNFGHGLGIHWSKGFPATTQAEMTQYCQEHGLTPQWQGGDKLRLTYRRWASLRHPLTGDYVWFNHATFFSFYSLPAETQQLIQQYVGKDKSPYDTFYGDGSEIGAETIALLKSLYEKHAVSIPYQQHDILLIDNLLVAHGRESYQGKREVFVTMTKKMRCQDFGYLLGSSADTCEPLQRSAELNSN